METQCYAIYEQAGHFPRVRSFLEGSWEHFLRTQYLCYPALGRRWLRAVIIRYMGDDVFLFYTTEVFPLKNGGFSYLIFERVSYMVAGSREHLFTLILWKLALIWKKHMELAAGWE